MSYSEATNMGFKAICTAFFAYSAGFMNASWYQNKEKINLWKQTNELLRKQNQENQENQVTKKDS